MRDLLPTVRLGSHDITRLIIGGNPFSGGSHLSPEFDRAFVDHYSNANIVRCLLECEAQGLNTLQTRCDRHMLRAIHEYRQAGGTMQWIAQTASELRDLHGNVRQAAAAGAIAVYHHGSRTDSLWQEGRVDEVRELLATMRDCGVAVGLGTHLPEVIAHAEENEWDVDFYMACVYALSRPDRDSPIVSGQHQEERFDHEDRAAMYAAIRATEKPCLAFKILAASRLCGSPAGVRDAFAEAFANIKPGDAVVVGMYQEHTNQVAMNAGFVRDICARRSGPERPPA